MEESFVSVLIGSDNLLSMHLWDRLLDQAQIMFNMLRPSRLKPKISAHEMMEGNFEFNKTPLAPPGTKAIFNEKLNKRRTWGYHGVQGWCIEPAVDHCQCYKVYISNTRSERIIDTVSLFPENTTMPGIFFCIFIHPCIDRLNQRTEKTSTSRPVSTHRHKKK